MRLLRLLGAIDSQGRIVAAGESGHDFALARSIGWR
jgi:hypothetical protein